MWQIILDTSLLCCGIYYYREHFYNKILASTTKKNNTSGAPWRWLRLGVPMTNTLAYLSGSWLTKWKSLMTWTTGLSSGCGSLPAPGFQTQGWPGKAQLLSWGQCYKTFLSVICIFLYQARVFVPGKLFQPSLMFVSKARPTWVKHFSGASL